MTIETRFNTSSLPRVRGRVASAEGASRVGASTGVATDPHPAAYSTQNAGGADSKRGDPPPFRGRDEGVSGAARPVSFQDGFVEALLDPEKPVPASLMSRTGNASVRRFAVYRNNVVVSLVDALASRFPATQRIVGEEFFRDMARLFVAARPPRSPLLIRYGDEFPDFIAGFAPAKELDYLPDVARLEAARTRAYHAADARPIDPARLAAIGEDALAGLNFVAHPSAEIIRSPHPIVTIWAMNAGERELGPIEDWGREDALVVRPELEVLVRALPAGGGVFLAALFEGATLAAAADAACEESAEFDLAANLAGLIGSGAVSEVLQPEVEKDVSR